MNAVSPSHQSESSHIRRLNLATDLDKVADLIELCFPIQNDPDGQTYVREMRQASREMRMLGWLSRFAEFNTTRAAGFVWEEDRKIIGNLSLVPFQERGHRIHLIANVAVHPDFRDRGIARALTERALGYLRRQNEPDVWLQVRDDNRAAIHLYRSTGFVDRASRTTWRIRPADVRDQEDDSGNGVKVRARQNHKWGLQKRWLDAIYPQPIRWNLGVDFRRLEPGPIQSISNFLDGVQLRNWQVEMEGEVCGFITWQKTSSYANNLWLAFMPETEEAALSTGLRGVLRHCASNHPISIDYPAGIDADQFRALGFVEFRTLIWMKHEIK